MKQKRILAAALTCALTLSLTACGNKPTEPTPPRKRSPLPLAVFIPPAPIPLPQTDVTVPSPLKWC